MPDSNMRTIDPQITGGDIFGLEVLVPEDAVVGALEVVAAETAISRERANSSTPKLHHPDVYVHMGWWTLLLPPVGLVLGLVYLWRVHRTGDKPKGHGFNLATIAVSFLLTMSSVVMLVLVLAD